MRIGTIKSPVPWRSSLYLKEQDRDPEDNVHICCQDVTDQGLVINGSADKRQGRADVLRIAHVLVRTICDWSIKQESKAVAIVHSLDSERLSGRISRGQSGSIEVRKCVKVDLFLVFANFFFFRSSFFTFKVHKFNNAPETKHTAPRMVATAAGKITSYRRENGSTVWWPMVSSDTTDHQMLSDSLDR